MNDQETQQLLYRAGRWPWKWFDLFRKAAFIAQQERCKFNVLQSEHHLLKMQLEEQSKCRLADCERIQELRDELQVLKTAVRELEAKDNIQTLELTALKEERVKIVDAYERASRGNRVYSEYIRRNQVVASNGKPIPEMPRFTNIFRQ